MSLKSEDLGYQAFRILQFAFVVAPILAGLDKFFNLMTDWSQYLSLFVFNIIGGHAHALMMAVGIVEIIAGIGTLLKPQVFGYIVALWLLAIIINLLLTGAYYDIALRDFGLGLGALAMAKLSKKYLVRS